MAQTRKPKPLLALVQELFRQMPEGMVLEEIVSGLHGVFRPKEVRNKLEELIGLGLMHKEVSPRGFRYYAHQKLFDLFYGQVPVAECQPLAEYRSSHEEVWLSPDPQAPRQLEAAREEARRAAWEREMERAITLMEAGKMVCPVCKGRRHKIGSPDHGGSMAFDAGSATCLSCDKHFYFRLKEDDSVKAEVEFQCYFSYSEGCRKRVASSSEELLERGWRRFPSWGDRIDWICAWCLEPKQQAARRARRRVAQEKEETLHCPHCDGTVYRLTSRSPTLQQIQREVLEYGTYLYTEVSAVCANPKCTWDFHPDLFSRKVEKRPNHFYLPDGHRRRACSCGKHAEIPEHASSTRCGCGRTLWLDYQDGERGSAGDPTSGTSVPPEKSSRPQ